MGMGTHLRGPNSGESKSLALLQKRKEARPNIFLAIWRCLLLSSDLVFIQTGAFAPLSFTWQFTARQSLGKVLLLKSNIFFLGDESRRNWQVQLHLLQISIQEKHTPFCYSQLTDQSKLNQSATRSSNQLANFVDIQVLQIFFVRLKFYHEMENR